MDTLSVLHPAVRHLHQMLPVLLLMYMLTDERLVSAEPELQQCNPKTAENGCDCLEEWWEPAMFLCKPCSKVCKLGADRDRCWLDCPVYAARLFTSTHTPSTTTTTTTTEKPTPKHFFAKDSESSSRSHLIPVVAVLSCLVPMLAAGFVIAQVRRSRSTSQWGWFDMCRRARQPIQETRHRQDSHQNDRHGNEASDVSMEEGQEGRSELCLPGSSQPWSLSNHPSNQCYHGNNQGVSALSGNNATDPLLSGNGPSDPGLPGNNLNDSSLSENNLQDVV